MSRAATADGCAVSTARAGESHFQPEIQGMRAIAVLAVVWAHAGLPGLPGGFTGVDVFFVISGFLITRLLLAELDRDGRIDLLAFWARRCRRLLPNAFAALAGTVLLALLVFPGYDLVALAREVRAAALEIVNFHFAGRGLDYFASDVPASPVLHFWSLSVEEQFYLAWPALLLGLAAAFGAGRRRPVIALLLALWCASFVACMIIARIETPLAYFGTHTRAWQLATGALLAAGWGTVSALPSAWRVRLAWAGLAAIAGGLVLIDGAGYPGFLALLPTLGAAALLAGFGAADRGGILRRALSAQPMQWIGERSYSWYLWHWPLIALPKVGYAGGVWMGVAGAAASLLIAWAAHKWIEAPLRRPGAGPRHAPMRVFAAAGAALVAVIGIAYAAAPALTVVNPDVAARLAAIRVALDSFSTPARDGCHLGRKRIDQPDCLYGDPAGPRRAVLWGDSHALQWFEAVNAAARGQGWQLRSWSKSGCPAADVAMIHEGRLYETCRKWREAALDKLTGADRPDLVILSSATRNFNRVSDPHTVRPLPAAEATQTWAWGFRRTIERLLAAGVRVAVIRDTPRTAVAYRTCLIRGGACVTPRTVALAGTPVDAEVAQSFGPRVTLLDFTDTICDAADCPVMRDGVIIYQDGDHITSTYAATFAPRIAALLNATGAQAGHPQHAGEPAPQAMNGAVR